MQLHMKFREVGRQLLIYLLALAISYQGWLTKTVWI